ncbi:MAG: hypothetical protein JWN48_6049 [Myxococcaceae bacterium]|nr:hypothetical protein [Myxococcaceae bacterium]
MRLARPLALRLVWLGAALGAVPCLAAAQSVALDLSGCAAPPAREVRILSALELRGRLVERAAAAQLHIAVTCRDARASLHSDEREESRELDLATVPPPLRARLLALAIAELAHGEARGDPAPALQEAGPAAPRTLERLQTEHGVRARAGAARGLRGFVVAGVSLQALPAWSAGAALSSLVRLTGLLAWSGALSLAQTRHDLDGGTLRIRSLGLRGGPALVLERARSLFYAGVAARLSLYALHGQPSDRSAARAGGFRTVVAGPELYGGAALALGRHALIGFELELAEQLRELRVEVEGGRASTLSSWRCALSLLAGAQW